MGTQGHAKNIVVLSGKRTPFGTFGGTLKNFTATDLAVFSSVAAIEAAGVAPDQIDHTFIGNALQTSSDAIYLARHVALRSGVPQESPALTVNRLCGSGFEAIVQGAKEILLDGAQVTLCGGTESMSQAPHVVRGARWGQLRLGPAGASFEDTLWEALRDSNCDMTMAQTAEELAERYEVTRDEADQMAVRSQQRAKAAWDGAHFAAEIAPIVLKSRKGEEEFANDEHMRPDTTLEALSGLRPYFKKDGLVTAGNASGIGDGAASAVLAEADWADRHGVEALGRIVSWGFAGVEPSVMGIGPAPASRLALERAGLTLDDMEPRGSERGVCGPVSGGREGTRTRSGDYERGWGSDRDHPSPRGIRGRASRSTFFMSFGGGVGSTVWGQPVSAGGRGVQWSWRLYSGHREGRRGGMRAHGQRDRRGGGEGELRRRRAGGE